MLSIKEEIMNLPFDSRGKNLEEFKKECDFFQQHYVFDKNEKFFKLVNFGSCKIRNDANCENCKYFLNSSKLNQADFWCSENKVIEELKLQIEALENIIKEKLNKKTSQ